MNSLLTEIERAIAGGTSESRSKALAHATEVLVAGTYNEDQIWVFGEVIEKLMEELETSARAELSKRFSVIENAPFQVMRKLALDESIGVAGPALQHSSRVDRSTLIAAATTKNADHLLALARRKSVDKPITDILVRRGNQDVVAALVNNDGAAFSEFGFLHLVQRTSNDSIVAEAFGLRKDIPRHIFQQLIAKASEEVRRKLLSQRRDLSSEIRDTVIDVTGRLHAKFGPASSEYFQAKRTIRSLREQGRLNEEQLRQFAQQHRFYEVVVALSTMCDVPPHLVERALTSGDQETVLILVKALDLSWSAAMALLFLGAPNKRISSNLLQQLEKEYLFLSVETSQEVLQVYRSRRDPEHQ